MRTLAFLLVVLGAILVRSPVVRRLALRSAVRRPREALLVIAGSVLGTAIITGSLVVGDTLTASIRQLARTQLGPVDEVVSLPDEVRWNLAREQAKGFDDPTFDGMLPVVTLATPAAAADGDPRPTAPRAQLFEVDFDAARGFGADPTSTGIVGHNPAPDRAAIAATLAEKLDVSRGDRIDVFVYGQPVRIVVDRVLPPVGIAGFTLGLGSLPDNIFVAPGFLRPHVDRAVERDLAVQPPRYRILASNDGGVESGASATPEAVRALQARFRGLDADFDAVKADLLRAADNSGKQMTTLFTAMGAFGVLAGVLLLVNVFAMLAEDRTSELGVMRAVGLRRRALVAAFTSEGFGYALIASAVGAAVGLGLGKVLLTLLVDVYTSGDRDGDFGFAIVFRAQPWVIANGFGAGLALSTLTVLLTSIRISRFDVIRAIRNLPEPARRQSRPWVQVAGASAVAVGALWAAVGIAAGDRLSKLLGPTLVALGFVPLLDRVVGRTAAVTATSLAALAWSAVILPLTQTNASDTVIPTIVQGVILTTAGVILVSFQQNRLGGLFRRFALGRHALAARMGLAYPVARRVRTGLTLAPFTIVVFTIAYVTMISTLINGELEHLRGTAGGDYDVVVRSSATSPLPVEELAARDDVEAVAPLAQVYAEFTGVSQPSPVPGLLTAFDARLAARRPPGLADRGAYRSDATAFRAVAADPGLVIVTARFFSNQRAATDNGGEPPRAQVKIGDPLTITDPVSGESAEVRVAAIASADVAFDGALYGFEGATAVFGGRVVHNRAYVRTTGADFKTFAASVGQQFLANGVEAMSIRELTDRIFSAIQGFIRLVQAFLGLGLVVGVTGIGVVMIRAVRERRRQIGMLRALGFDAPTIGRMFVFEAGFVALEGVVLGIGLSLLVMYSLVNSNLLLDLLGSQPSFEVPVWALLTLASASLIAALLATFAPARAAARVAPSEALRVLD